MSRPKHHHYVPRWYLSQFANPKSNLLHVWDRRSRRFWQEKPENLMRIRRYYRQQSLPSGMDPDSLELHLGTSIEPDAKSAFAKLVASPHSLTADDTSAMVLYVALQRLRVPRQIAQAQRLYRRLILSKAPDEIVRPILDGQMNLTITDGIKFPLMRNLTDRLSRMFGRMEWHVIRTSRGSEFVTTDNPVTFHNEVVRPPIGEPGIGHIGTSVLFPLGPGHVLLLIHPEYEGKCKTDPMQPAPEPPKGDTRLELKFPNDEWPSDIVREHNWRMAQYADRLVVSGDLATLTAALK